MKNSNFYCFNKRELIAILTEKFPKITFYEFSIFWGKNCKQSISDRHYGLVRLASCMISAILPAVIAFDATDIYLSLCAHYTTAQIIFMLVH